MTQRYPVWKTGFKHEFPPWPLLCSLIYSHKTQAKELLHSLWSPHWQLPLTWVGKCYFLSLSFLLIQLSAKTDSDSLGLEVRGKNYMTTKRVIWKPAVTRNTLQNFVYNLLQLWFQAHGCYFYAFLLNKTVKIKSKLQAGERKHRILKYLSSI